MSFRGIERLRPVLRDADHAILTGDLTHFGDPPDAFRVVDAVGRVGSSVVATLAEVELPVVATWFVLAVAVVEFFSSVSELVTLRSLHPLIVFSGCVLVVAVL